MPDLVNAATDLVARLRRVLLTVELDCHCRRSLEGALIRFASLEHRRQRRKALADARENKDQITARLVFLAELDDLTDLNADETVFEEMVLLFDEIGDASAAAADAIRSIALVRRSKKHARPLSR